jgi:signal transduction histidine kinase
MSHDEDDRRHEFICNIILAGSIILLSIYYLLVIDHSIVERGSYQGVSVLFFGIIISLFIGLLVMSRRGYFTLASYIMIGIYFLAATYGAYHFGTDLQGVLLAYVIVIIISSILISVRFGFLMTLLISGTVFTLWHFQIHNIITAQWYWKYKVRETDSVVFIVMFFLIMSVSWLSNREMEQSLRRARTSESELKHERDNLEMIVEKRTREIKTLQADKLAQLYRSAEFGKLSTGIFHDLMNPLNSVIANVSQLESNQGNISDVKNYLEKAVSASRRMGDFLGTIRKQIRVDDRMERFMMNKELSEAVDILKYKAREAHVTIVTTIEKELYAFGNPLKFHQVALNLISNAIDACEHRNDSAVSIKLEQEDTFAKIIISDNGCGIPEHLTSKVFDTFFTTKDHSKGMGLGLSTTKEIIENHFHGTISLASIHNKGTTFIVLIPLA